MVEQEVVIDGPGSPEPWFTLQSPVNEMSFESLPPMTCLEKCKRTFKSQEAFDKHVAGISKCNNCGEIFCHSANFKRHFQRTKCPKNKSVTVMNKTVSGSREYSCFICGKEFTQKCHLTRHQKSRCSPPQPETSREFVESLQQMEDLPEPLHSSPMIQNHNLEPSQSEQILEEEKSMNCFQDIHSFYIQGPCTQNEDDDNSITISKCKTCKEDLVDYNIAKHHNQSCQWMKDPEVDCRQYRKLRGHPYEDYAYDIIDKLSPVHQIDLCDISDLAVPKIFPLLFRSNKHMGKNKKFYAIDHIKKINMYLQTKSAIILPKYIELHCNDSLVLYIGPKFTKPVKSDLMKYRMNLTETNCSFIIQKNKTVISRNPAIDTTDHQEVDIEREAEVLDERTQELLTPSDLASVVGEESVDNLSEQNEEQGEIMHDDSADSILNNPSHARFSVAEEPEANLMEVDDYSTISTLNVKMRKYRNMFMSPEKLGNDDFVALIHITKNQFLEFCEELRQYLPASTNILSLYSRAFLFRLRLASSWTQDEISSIFCITPSTGRAIFWKVVKTYYENMVNLPNFLLNDDVVEQVFQEAADNLDPYYKELLSLLPDPKGLGRKPIPILTDATYQPIMISRDSQLQKLLFFEKGGGPVVKVMTFCTTDPKVLYILPQCSSQSPASGDAVLAGNHAAVQDLRNEKALRKFLAGSSKYFVVVFGDAGYQFVGKITLPKQRYISLETLIAQEGGIFLGTKYGEYLLNIDNGVMVKEPFDPLQITRAQNTVKYTRCVRNKVENKYAGAKQKYQLMENKIPLSFLDDLYEGEEDSVSKYTALTTIIFSLFNAEHGGFPVNFIPEDMKVWKAQQLLKNFTVENFLLHVDVTKLGGWKRIKTEAELDETDIPGVTPDTFNQLLELTSSVHSLTKAISVKSNLRRQEVDEMDDEEVRDFEQYSELIKEGLSCYQVSYLRLETAPADYMSKQAAGILPPWPGKGCAYQVTCLPHYKSATQKINHRQPVIYFLDSSEPNPLHCSDRFKRVAAMHCYKCPSLNGSISGCCHIGFLLLVLTASWFLNNVNVNKPVKLVSIKNKYLFQHPKEAVQSKTNKNIHRVFNLTERTSENKRRNCPFSNAEVQQAFIEDYYRVDAEAQEEDVTAGNQEIELSSLSGIENPVDVTGDINPSNQCRPLREHWTLNLEPAGDQEEPSSQHRPIMEHWSLNQYSGDEEASEIDNVSNDFTDSTEPQLSNEHSAETHLSSQHRPIREHWTLKCADTHSQASEVASVTSKESSMYGHTGADKTKALKRMREMDPNFPVLNTVQSHQGSCVFSRASLHAGFKRPKRSNLCFINSLYCLMHRIDFLSVLNQDLFSRHDKLLTLCRSILEALPSKQSFNLKPFMDEWNLRGFTQFKEGDQHDPSEFMGVFLMRYEMYIRTGSLSKYFCKVECRCGSKEDRDYYSGMPFGGIPVYDVVRREGGPPVELDSLRESYVRINKITERCRVNGCESRIRDCPIYEKKGKIRLCQINRTMNDGSRAQTRVQEYQGQTTSVK